MRKSASTKFSLSVFVRDHLVAWATFVAVFCFAVSSPAAKKSFDQGNRNQLALSEGATAELARESAPLGTGLHLFLPVAQALGGERR